MYSAVKRYAFALFKLAEEKGCREEVHRDLKMIVELIGKSGPLERFLKNPAVISQVRQTILKDIFEGKIHSLTYHFILFLEEKRRLNFLKNIAEYFEQLFLKEEGIVEVKVTSSFLLNPHQMHVLTEHLKEKFKAHIQPVFNVNPDIIGGIRIQKDDHVYDYSLRSQLDKWCQFSLTN